MNRMVVYLIWSGSLLLASLQPLFAGEFLVFRRDRTFAVSDNGFHYYYQEGDAFPDTWPTNWVAPVDYYDGSWYVRVALKTTPQSLPVTYQTCIWMHDADGVSSTTDELESCSQVMVEMDAPFVHAISTGPIRNWWHKNEGANAVDLSRPDDFKRLGLVLRTAAGCYVSPYNVEPNCWDQRADYLPMTFHLTIVAVSEGGVFSGWNRYVTVDPSRAPATFTVYPVDVTVAAGDPATLSVQASGTPALTYQWQVCTGGSQFTNIRNSNAPSYTIPSAQGAMSGYRFRCIVSNGYGTETSAPVTLTVSGVSTAARGLAAPGRARGGVRSLGDVFGIDGRRVRGLSSGPGIRLYYFGGMCEPAAALTAE